MTPEPETGAANDSVEIQDGSEPSDEQPQRQQTGRPDYVKPAEEMDWRGWLLVGAVFVCFLVLPVSILFIPQAQSLLGSLGLSLRQAYLAMPMIPAILLGIIAVWAALRTQTVE
jgi:hypothetical protein